MMKRLLKLSVVTTAILGTSGMLLALMNARAASPAASQPVAAIAPPAPAPAPPAAPAVLPPAPQAVVPDVSVLDSRRQFALGMIETGNNDREIGGAGEISRYQIMPSVWHQFSDSRSYRNPSVSLKVAQQLWTTLHARFKQQARREPTDFDMYVLWNTRYGYYASKGFKPARLNATVRDRAQRFVNLVEKAPAEGTLLAAR